jgi:hypothetical protein
MSPLEPLSNRSLARRTAGTGFGTGFITRRAVGKGF